MTSNAALKATLHGLYFSGISTVARFWMGGIGSILMLHRVQRLAPADFSPNAHLSVSPRFLDRLLGVLSRQVDFVSLDEAARRIRTASGRTDRPFVAVTLDDGYRDNLENAVPLFRKHAVPYTIFIAPGLIEGEATLWWEDLEQAIAARDHFLLPSQSVKVEFDVSTPARKRKVFAELLSFLTVNVSEAEQRGIVAELSWQADWDAAAHVRDSIMNWREIVDLARDPLCTIGAHTMNHFAVARLKDRDARREMVESARVLDLELGERPRHFAYPYGYPAAAGKREFAMAREAGFETAVTTRHGVIYPAHAAHMHALPRISVNGHFQAVRHVQTLISGVPTRIANRGRALNVG